MATPARPKGEWTMYEKLLKEIETEITLHRHVIDLLESIPELEGIYNMFTYKPGSLIYSMPYDLQMFERNKNKLVENGWEFDGDMEVKPFCGAIMPEFTKEGIRISFQINPVYSGSTCKRTVIGYEKTPIYEVTCMEA
jgi:hypothetical protein